MAAERLEDMQEVTLTVAAQATKGSVTITHNLQDRAGDELTPDTIHAELIAYAGFVADSEPPIQQFVPVRSTPEDGTFVLWGIVPIGSDHEIDYTVRVYSVYTHSIQGADHTP